MRVSHITPALAALGILFTAAPSLADDPRDPAMRNRAAREADAAEIRRLNLAEAEYVRRRDAQYAQGWQAWSDQREGRGAYARAGAPQDTRSYGQERYLEPERAPAPSAPRDQDYTRWRDQRDERLAYDSRAGADYARDMAAYEDARRSSEADREAYSRARSDYAAAMADWRRDVSACRAGYYERCDR